MSEEIIETKGLTKEYRLGQTKVYALRGVDMSARKGTFLSIVGPSGSGKTTLLNIIGGLDRPTSGNVLLDGIDLTTVPERKLHRIRRSKIGFIFQHFYLIPTLTALENVLVPTIPIKGRGFEERARELLSVVGLSERQKHRPNQLSGGEQQRVAICRALINEPEVLLCDEITGELDTETGEQIVALLRRINQERGLTVLLITHDQGVTAGSDRIITLSDGRIVADKTLRKAKSSTN